MSEMSGTMHGLNAGSGADCRDSNRVEISFLTIIVPLSTADHASCCLEFHRPRNFVT